MECDEHDHKDRDINYEIRRQKFIEDQLNCKFTRHKPDAKDFVIESVLNKIFQYIYQKSSTFKHGLAAFVMMKTKQNMMKFS